MSESRPSFWKRIATLRRRKQPVVHRIELLAPTVEMATAFVTALGRHAPGETGGLFISGFDEGKGATRATRAVFLTGNGKRRSRGVDLRVASWASFEVDAEDERSPATGTMIFVVPCSLATGTDRQAIHDAEYQIARAAAFARAEGRLRRVAIALIDLPRDAGPFHGSQSVCNTRNSQGWTETVSGKLEAASLHPGEGLADPRWRRFLASTAKPAGLLSRLLDKLREGLACDVPVFFFNEAAQEVGTAEALSAWLAAPASLSENRKTRRRLRVAAAISLCACLTSLVIALRAAPLGPAPSVPGSESDDAALGRAAVTHRAGYRATTEALLFGDSARERLAHAAEALERSTPPAAPPVPPSLDVLERQRKLAAARAQFADRLTALQEGRGVLREAASGKPTDRATPIRALANLVEDAVSWRALWLLGQDVRGLSPEVSAPLDDVIEKCAREVALASMSFEGGAGRPISSGELTGRMATAARAVGRTATAGMLVRSRTAKTPVELYDAVIPSVQRITDSDAKSAACELLPRMDDVALLPRLVPPPPGTAPDPAQVALARRVRAIEGRTCSGSQPLIGAEAAAAAKKLLGSDNDWKKPKMVTWSCSRVSLAPWHADFLPPNATESIPCQWLNGAGADSTGCLVAFEVRPGDKVEVSVNRMSATHVRAGAAGAPCVGSSSQTVRIDGPRFVVVAGSDSMTCTAVAGWGVDLPAAEVAAARENTSSTDDQAPQPFAEITATLLSSDKDGFSPAYRIDTLTNLSSGGGSLASQLDVACPARDLQTSYAHFGIGDTLDFRWKEHQRRHGGRVLRRGEEGRYELAPPSAGWPTSCVGPTGLDRHDAQLGGLFFDGSEYVRGLLTVSPARMRPGSGAIPVPPTTIQVRLYWRTGAEAAAPNPTETASSSKGTQTEKSGKRNSAKVP